MDVIDDKLHITDYDNCGVEYSINLPKLKRINIHVNFNGNFNIIAENLEFVKMIILNSNTIFNIPKILEVERICLHENAKLIAPNLIMVTHSLEMYNNEITLTKLGYIGLLYSYGRYNELNAVNLKVINSLNSKIFIFIRSNDNITINRVIDNSIDKFKLITLNDIKDFNKKYFQISLLWKK